MSMGWCWMWGPVDATEGALREAARMVTAFMSGREAACKADLGGAKIVGRRSQAEWGGPGEGGEVAIRQISAWPQT